jgi:hypothetical protein
MAPVLMVCRECDDVLLIEAKQGCIQQNYEGKCLLALAIIAGAEPCLW